MKPTFEEIPIGLTEGKGRGWLVYLSGRLVAVLAQPDGTERTHQVRLAAGLIEPYASQWERSSPSLKAARKDFREVLALYRRGFTEPEVQAWSRPPT